MPHYDYGHTNIISIILRWISDQEQSLAFNTSKWFNDLIHTNNDAHSLTSYANNIKKHEVGILKQPLTVNLATLLIQSKFRLSIISTMKCKVK